MTETTRMMLFDQDCAVCVGGKWDGWIFHRHPDGEWVSVRQAAQEVMETISPAPDARDEALRLAKEALAGVIRVADRKTTEFDAARAARAAIDALEG